MFNRMEKALISARQNRVGWASTLRDGTPLEVSSTGAHGEEHHAQLDRAAGLRHKGMAPRVVRLGAVNEDRVVLAMNRAGTMLALDLKCVS